MNEDQPYMLNEILREKFILVKGQLTALSKKVSIAAMVTK